MRTRWVPVLMVAVGLAAAPGCKERTPTERPAPKATPPGTAQPAPRPPVAAPEPQIPGRYQGVDRVASPGTIRGRVRWKGSRPQLASLPVRTDRRACGDNKPSNRLVIGPRGGAKNAIVSLVDIHAGRKLDTSREAFLDQVKCRYVPHVQVVPVGGRLTAINSDPVVHNVHAYLGATTVFNVGMPLKGQRIPRKIVHPGMMEVSCDAGHTWMSAYVLAVEHPYHVVTDGAGAYTLTDVPAGTYRIQMWHEGWKVARRSPEGRSEYVPPTTATRTVTVVAGKAATVDFTLSDE